MLLLAAVFGTSHAQVCLHCELVIMLTVHEHTSTKLQIEHTCTAVASCQCTAVSEAVCCIAQQALPVCSLINHTAVLLVQSWGGVVSSFKGVANGVMSHITGSKVRLHKIQRHQPFILHIASLISSIVEP